MLRHSSALLGDVLVCESPNKVKTLSKILNNRGDGKPIKIIATSGHISEIDTFCPYHFEPVRKLTARKDLMLSFIQQQHAGEGTVYLALDPDREGEVIAQDVWTELKKLGVSEKDMARVSFAEITESAVLEAMKKPGQINYQLVQAGWARGIIDYWFGIVVSTHLRSYASSCKSAGRVQSPTLRMICDREAEIAKFKQETYYVPVIHAQKRKLSVVCGKKNKLTKEEAKDIAAHIKNHPEWTYVTESKPMQAAPPAFLDTATVLKDACKALKLSLAEVTAGLQKLFEMGAITYIRTDSTKISKQGAVQLAKAIRDIYGEEYVYDLGSAATNAKGTSAKKAPMTQEAHEAIRPTNPRLGTINGAFPAQQALYTFIRDRTLEAAMPRPKYDVTTTTLTCAKPFKNNPLIAKHESKVTLFPGSEVLHPKKKASAKDDDDKSPAFDAKGKLTVLSLETKTVTNKAPKRLTVGDLVSEMKKHGIGRPSTYSSTVEKLFSRSYIAQVEESEVGLTEIGNIANDFMTKVYPDWMDYKYTSKLEKNLNKVASGKLDYTEYMTSFRTDFAASMRRTPPAGFAPYRVTVEEEKESGMNIYHGAHSYQLGELGLVKSLPIIKGAGKDQDLSYSAFMNSKHVKKLPIDFSGTKEDKAAMMKERATALTAQKKTTAKTAKTVAKKAKKEQAKNEKKEKKEQAKKAKKAMKEQEKKAKKAMKVNSA